MTYLPLGLAVATAVLFGALLGVGAFGYVAFLLCGLAAYALATNAPPGAERVYWGVLAAIIALLAAVYFNVDVHRLVMIAPLVLAASYFVARLSRRFVSA